MLFQSDSKGENKAIGVIEDISFPPSLTTAFPDDRLKAVSRPLGAETIQNSYTYTNDKLSAITQKGFSKI